MSGLSGSEQVDILELYLREEKSVDSSEHNTNLHREAHNLGLTTDKQLFVSDQNLI